MRAEVSSYLPPAGNHDSQSEVPLSPQSKELLAAAERAADLLSHRHILDYHILLGLITLENCVATQVLRRHGVSIEYPREQLPPFNPDQLPAAERKIYDLNGHLLELAQKRDYHGVLRGLDDALADPSLDQTAVIRRSATFGYVAGRAVGDFERAKYYCELRLTCDPDNILALYEVASCFKALGKSDDALQYAQQCYKISSSRTGAIAEGLVESLEAQFPELRSEARGPS